MNQTVFLWIQTGILVCLLAPAVVIDVKKHIIPNKIPLGLTAAKCGLFLAAFLLCRRADGIDCLKPGGQVFQLLTGSGLGLLGAVLLSGICLLAVKDGIGMGDVKLLLALGFFQGGSAFLRGLAWTGIAAMIAAVVQIAVKREEKDKRIAFAPFLAFGAVVSQLSAVLAL